MPHDLPAYAAWLRSHNSADRTVDDRVRFARRLVDAWPDLAAVTEDDLRGLLGDPAYGRWTRATYYNHMRSFFRWLHETGQAPEDPTAGMTRPPAPRLSPRPLAPAEADRALAAAGATDYALLALGMLAGLRAHEAAKVHSRDVSETHLYVVGKGGREAQLPTHPTIWRLAQGRDGYWFPTEAGHLTALTVSLRVTRLFSSLGIDGSFHRCRHYYGTSLLRAGVNIRVVQELMRHASLATTAAYLGVGEDEKTAAIMQLAA